MSRPGSDDLTQFSVLMLVTDSIFECSLWLRHFMIEHLSFLVIYHHYQLFYMIFVLGNGDLQHSAKLRELGK